MSRICTMRTALTDPAILGWVLPGDTLQPWRVILIGCHGERLTDDERAIFTALTGREREPNEPCDEVWGVVGRRGGKTRAFAAAAAYMAGCVDDEGRFAPGQRGRLLVMAAAKDQATEAFRYLLGIFQEVPMFADMLHGPATADMISLEGACIEFAATLKRYGVSKVVGDNYANEWPKEMMRKQGIAYEPSSKPKGTIYAEFLPLVNSRRVRLLDHDPMRKQLLNLERRVAWSGRDSIDHPANCHDDLINAAAGVLVGVGTQRISTMHLL